MIRYELDTGTRHFGKFGTNSMPVPDTCESLSLKLINTSTRHFGKFGTTPVSVPGTSICGTPTQVYPGYRYILDHNIGGTSIVYLPGTGLDTLLNTLVHSVRTRYRCRLDQAYRPKFKFLQSPMSTLFLREPEILHVRV